MPLIAQKQEAVAAEQRGKDKAIEEIRQREARVTELLKYLASERPKERPLAISVLKGISHEHELPDEPGPALISIAVNDDDPTIVNAGYRAVDATPPSERARPALQQPGHAAELGAGQLPARSYVHIGAEEQRDSAHRLEVALEQTKEIVVPGIERVPKPPNVSDLRCFWRDDQAEAESTAKRLAGLGIQAKVVFPERFAGSGRPRHFELWLARDAS